VLIKLADDQSAVRNLERTAAGNGPDAKRAAEELRIHLAGMKGESQSAYLIAFLAASRNWAVIHA
jgi:hypothetical protein